MQSTKANNPIKNVSGKKYSRYTENHKLSAAFQIIPSNVSQVSSFYWFCLLTYLEIQAIRVLIDHIILIFVI